MRKFALFLALFLCCCCLSARADTYTNPETGYRAVLLDDNDLLTEAEEAELMETMKKLTGYTNAAFWSTATAGSQSQAINNAEKKHISLFGSYVNGIVFMIDMKARYMFLDTEGWIQGVIPKSTAQIITNNVRSAMTAGQYFSASQKVFRQVQSKIDGEKIAEPMRYLSAVSIGIMGGLLFALFLTITLRNAVLPLGAPRYYTRMAAAATVVSVTSSRLIGALAMKRYGEPVVTRTYSPVQSSSSSCSSCSSCSSGSSCSSCSSGSSCGGGSSF